MFQEQIKLKATACFAPLAAFMSIGAKQAFAVEDLSDAPSLFSCPDGKIMYALVAVQAIALIGAAVGGNNHHNFLSSFLLFLISSFAHIKNLIVHCNAIFCYKRVTFELILVYSCFQSAPNACLCFHCINQLGL